MEALPKPHLHPFAPKPHHFMTPPLVAKFALPLLGRTSTTFRLFATAQLYTSETTLPEPSTSNSPPKVSTRASKIIDAQQLKFNWLDSISCPFLDENENKCSKNSDFGNAGSESSSWVVGIDPDVSGALALLKPDDFPQEPLHISSNQSHTHKMGWWSGGFGYGLWLGTLVASGFSVVPVPSLLWKNEFKLAGNRSSKDDSRELASTLFPSLSSLLKRKKDHGRAEALLIAAYGKGMKANLNSSCTMKDLTP